VSDHAYSTHLSSPAAVQARLTPGLSGKGFSIFCCKPADVKYPCRNHGHCRTVQRTHHRIAQARLQHPEPHRGTGWRPPFLVPAGTWHVRSRKQSLLRNYNSSTTRAASGSAPHLTSPPLPGEIRRCNSNDYAHRKTYVIPVPTEYSPRNITNGLVPPFGCFSLVH